MHLTPQMCFFAHYIDIIEAKQSGTISVPFSATSSARQPNLIWFSSHLCKVLTTLDWISQEHKIQSIKYYEIKWNIGGNNKWDHLIFPLIELGASFIKNMRTPTYTQKNKDSAHLFHTCTTGCHLWIVWMPSDAIKEKPHKIETSFRNKVWGSCSLSFRNLSGVFIMYSDLILTLAPRVTLVKLELISKLLSFASYWRWCSPIRLSMCFRKRRPPDQFQRHDFTSVKKHQTPLVWARWEIHAANQRRH